MDIAVEIEAVVNKLSYRWYEKKHKEFVDIKRGYDPVTNTRIDKWPGNIIITDEKTGEQYPESVWEDTLIATIEDFCWCDEERFSIHSNSDPRIQLSPVDAETLITVLCGKINDFLPKDDVISSYNIVNNVQILFREKMNGLASNNSDQQYRRVCYFISEKGSSLIRTLFDDVAQRFKYGEQSPHRLEFDLNKQQLAALIFLMDQAGFITNKPRNEGRKYEFFENHFFWTNSAKDTQHPLTGLKGLMEKIRSSEKARAVDEVMDMLKRAHKK
jgi:hypothetical protein